MTNLNEKTVEKVEELMKLVNDNLKFGNTFEEAMPAISYFCVMVDGKEYWLKLKVDIIG